MRGGVDIGAAPITSSYTPGKDTNNSCLSGPLLEVKTNTKYVATCTIEWSGGFDTSSTAGTFALYFQGSTKGSSDTSYGWTKGNVICAAANNALNLTNTVTASASGSRDLELSFNSGDLVGMYFGLRANYSNGKGTIGIRNFHCYEASTYVNGTSRQATITNSNKLAAREIVEY